ncbi:MAG: aa3-type cytochrome c oxidase subunit IV [Caulobacteraceae bacterium]
MDAAHNNDHGHMDIREQRETFHAFIKLSKWGSLIIGVGVLFFSMWLCTPAGFFSAAITAGIVAVAGFFLLKEKRRPHA